MNAGRFSPGLDRSGIAEAFRRAVAFQNSGNLAEAERLCRKVLKGSDKYFDARHLLGVLCFQQGRTAEAADVLAVALEIKPDAVIARCHLGLVLQELGRHEQALANYDKALAIRPDFLDALNNRASALIELKRFEEALADYDRTLAIKPAYFEALYNRGIALGELGRFREAVTSYDRALALRPDHVGALNRRGIAFDELRCHDEALASYDKALAINPDDAELLNNRGIALEALRRYDEAEASYGKALAIKPDYTEALNNRANALIELGRFEEALALYETLFSGNPDYAPGHWNRSMLLLRLGSFEAGWREFEWRRKKESWLQRKLGGSEWTGEALPRKRLLLYSEAGLGDTIQFARFASSIAKVGGEITLEVQPVLAGLLASLPDVCVIPAGQELPAFDVHLPLMSVPFVRGANLATLPTDIPYIAADPARIERWAKALPQDKFKVGIVWQGNPHPGIDNGRSIPLRAFAPLSAIPGVSLISLQKNHGVEQLSGLPAGMTVETLGNDFDSGPDAFLDSAAVMMSLDLIISSDTAMAHLAGALGRPLWIALKHVPDWRWMMDRTDTPWYPTARLFRQSRRDDWNDVFMRIASELTLLVSTSASQSGVVSAPISIGELIDKIVILEIKASKMTDTGKLDHIRQELALLASARSRLPLAEAEIEKLKAELKGVNEALWEIEDRIRDCERAQDFGPEFIELARSVYRTNDRRAAIKRQINELAGSAIIEEKSYSQY